MREKIEKILREKEGYSALAAKVTASDLCSIRDPEIMAAVAQWAAGGEKSDLPGLPDLPDLKEGKFSCVWLMEHCKMKYPAALIFIDWYRQDPQTALRCLQEAIR